MNHFNRFREQRRLLLWIVVLAGMSIPANAQRMSPMQQDFERKARGSVEVANADAFPKFLACKAEGFDVDDRGKIALHPLDPDLHVRIASERTEIGPKQSKQISFDATPATVPAWFAVLCEFSPVNRQAAITVNMAIFSVILVHGPEKAPPSIAATAKYVGGKVIVELENTGTALERVNSCTISGQKGKVEIPRVLLFPKRKRIAEADWAALAAPERVRIQVGKKTLEVQVN